MSALGVAACGEATRVGLQPSSRDFVGQSPERGHLIREPLSAAAPVESIRVDVLVVGAGVAGISAAWSLERAGIADVLMVEMEQQAGGTAASGALPRSPHPLGAHYLPAPTPHTPELEELLIELEIGWRRATPDGNRLALAPQHVCGAPLERHFYRGQWHPGLYPFLGQSGEEQAQYEAWQALLTKLDGQRGDDGRRLFSLPVSSSSAQLRALDTVDFRSYLQQQGIQSWRVHWLADYACRDDYGAKSEHTSAFAGLHHFLCRGYEEIHDRDLLTWAEGNAALVSRMLARVAARDRLRSGAVVRRVDPRDGVALILSEHGVVKVTAKHIIWAAPRFLLPWVLNSASDDPVGAHELHYSPWLVANLELISPPAGVGVPLAWDNVEIEGNSLGYVNATHQRSSTDQDASTVITYYEALAHLGIIEGRRWLLSQSLEALSEHVLTQLRQMHPRIDAQLTAMNIARWGHGMVRPVPGHLFHVAPKARQPIGRVWPCAADVAGLPLFEEAFYCGRSAATQVAAALGYNA